MFSFESSRLGMRVGMRVSTSELSFGPHPSKIATLQAFLRNDDDCDVVEERQTSSCFLAYCPRPTPALWVTPVLLAPGNDILVQRHLKCTEE
jgi:hypothetical protein